MKGGFPQNSKLTLLLRLAGEGDKVENGFLKMLTVCSHEVNIGSFNKGHQSPLRVTLMGNNVFSRFTGFSGNGLKILRQRSGISVVGERVCR